MDQTSSQAGWLEQMQALVLLDGRVPSPDHGPEAHCKTREQQQFLLTTTAGPRHPLLLILNSAPWRLSLFVPRAPCTVPMQTRVLELCFVWSDA